MFPVSISYYVLPNPKLLRARSASKKNLDDWMDNGREESYFPKVDFSCFKCKYPVTLRGIDVFERAKENLKIGVTVLQYETEFEEGEHSNEKGVIFPVRAPSIKSVKH